MVVSSKLAAYFQNTFSWEHIWAVAPEAPQNIQPRYVYTKILE